MAIFRQTAAAKDIPLGAADVCKILKPGPEEGLKTDPAAASRDLLAKKARCTIVSIPVGSTWSTRKHSPKPPPTLEYPHDGK